MVCKALNSDIIVYAGRTLHLFRETNCQIELTLRIIATIITFAWIIVAIVSLVLVYVDKDIKVEFGGRVPAWWIIVIIIFVLLSIFVLSALWII